MGMYFPRPDDVKSGQVGRELTARSYDAARRELRSGEHLYLLGDKLVRHIAVCVDDENEFTHFVEQYNRGMLMSYRLVALNEEEHAAGG